MISSHPPALSLGCLECKQGRSSAHVTRFALGPPITCRKPLSCSYEALSCSLRSVSPESPPVAADQVSI